MTRGIILFAFNSIKYNYYEMAEFTAKRVNHFLGLPVTLVTDEESLPTKTTYVWDKVITVTPNKDNFRTWGQWINKGRYQAYELSPYDETILLDVDYVVNSDKLLKTFEVYDDFCCHNTTKFLMQPAAPQDYLSDYSYPILWATVVAFKKTDRANQIFNTIKMIQNNYQHYENIHRFVGGTYRNDFALTLALRIVNGHSNPITDYLPWNLVHIGTNTQIYANNDTSLNTEYTVMFDSTKNGKNKKEYMLIKDMDFHILVKEIYIDMIKGKDHE